MILDETSKSFSKFNTTGCSLLIKFNSLGESKTPQLILRNALLHVGGSVNPQYWNVEDEIIGISLGRRDKLEPEMVWSVLGKLVQSNVRFPLTDRLEVHLENVRMCAGNGREKTKGRSLDVLSLIKRNTVVVKEAFLCLARALITAMAPVSGDPKYKLYRNEYGIKKMNNS